MKYERQDHLIKILLKYFKGISPIAIIDLVETLWPGRSQSDWNETNINSPTYIIGKPDLSDEKVGFVTPEFEIANTPGYLSTDYFEAETDLVTGRTIITPKILTPYGGIVTLRTGLIFDISKGGRVINGKFYEAEADSITLTAHATLDKVVVFYMDNTGSYGVLESTPGVLLKPSIDPLTQVELTSVTIPAAATTIPNVNEVVIYNEHTGAEWTPSIEGTTADFDSTVAPSTGSICAAIGELSNGDRIVFTDDVDYTDTDWSTLIMDIQLPNSNSFGNFIEAYFEKDGKPRSSLVYATYNRFNTNWQTVVFVISDFAVRNALFNGFVLRWNNMSGATYPSIKIDNVRLQKGIDLPVSEDSYSTGVSFDTVTRILTIERNNGLPAMSANIPIGYNWNLHSPEQIMGYVGTPVGLNIAVNGSGSVDYTVPIDTLAVTALNAQGETTPAYNSAFDILTDTTDALITWIEDANATGYRIYKNISSVWYYIDTATDNIDYLELVPGVMTAGAPPTENTAAILQTAFTIDNGDTVEITGEGIDVETSVDPLDSTKKEIHLVVNPAVTDEKVKFDAADPTAGYLSAKVVPGANIAISEGTGADENKLKIAVTGLAAVAYSGSYNSLTDKPTIPATADLPFQSLTAKDITPGTAQEYPLIPKCREGLTIDSLVYKTDNGTLTGCAVKIGSTAVTGLSSLSVGTTQAETNATGANTTAAGDRVTFVTSTGYTGTPTMIEIQLNYHKT